MSLPPRYSAESVEKFWPFIIDIATNPLPRSYLAATTGLQPTTLSVHLSNALRAVVDNKVVTPDPLIAEQIRKIRKTFRISTTATHVNIELRKADVANLQDAIVSANDLDRFSIVGQVDDACAHAIALLLSRKLLVQPVKLFGISKETLAYLTLNYDIVATEEVDGSVIMH